MTPAVPEPTDWLTRACNWLATRPRIVIPAILILSPILVGLLLGGPA